jgi:hypothetical protein
MATACGSTAHTRRVSIHAIVASKEFASPKSSAGIGIRRSTIHSRGSVSTACAPAPIGPDAGPHMDAVRSDEPFKLFEQFDVLFGRGICLAKISVLVVWN